ncbi:MAG: DUF2190 family protein [Desulfobulbaceae bacterium]|jgi:predicted RecA/RadA family phage recombinase|nr:DUF2190 family protein [Desulfobulbaceae bacterium]
MADNHIQPGESMSWTNATGADVLSGAPILVGNRLCVALGDIADTESGMLATCEVFELPKVAATVIAQGADVYWDDTAKNVTNVATANTLAGCCFVGAASADATIQIKLGG